MKYKIESRYIYRNIAAISEEAYKRAVKHDNVREFEADVMRDMFLYSLDSLVENGFVEFQCIGTENGDRTYELKMRFVKD